MGPGLPPTFLTTPPLPGVRAASSDRAGVRLGPGVAPGAGAGGAGGPAAPLVSGCPLAADKPSCVETRPAAAGGRGPRGGHSAPPPPPQVPQVGPLSPRPARPAGGPCPPRGPGRGGAQPWAPGAGGAGGGRSPHFQSPGLSTPGGPQNRAQAPRPRRPCAWPCSRRTPERGKAEPGGGSPALTGPQLAPTRLHRPRASSRRREPAAQPAPTYPHRFPHHFPGTHLLHHLPHHLPAPTRAQPRAASRTPAFYPGETPCPSAAWRLRAPAAAES